MMIEELLRELRQVNKRELWDAQDIADYLKLAKSTVKSHIVCKPDFPKAIKINSVRRWEPEEVIAWARKHRSSD
ncbi:MAG: hypothetical protein WEB57_08265 [Pseudohongiellaceae bacterium]